MRLPLIRLGAVVTGVVVVMSCDAGPAGPRFGNGISGGPTGTSPVTPVNPSAPDTNRPFAQIQTPATTGQLVNIGDSLLVVTRIIDDRQLSRLTLVGMKYVGDASLGTLQEIARYPAVVAPAPGAVPFRTGLTDTTVRRFLKPAVPIDSTIDSLVIFAIARDLAGNVDTARRRVNLVKGPSVTVIAPVAGDEVSQNVAMLVQARVTHVDGVRDVTIRVQGEATWPASARLDTTITTTIVGLQRDVTVSNTILIPLTAPERGRVTITVSAFDINSNPGAAPAVVVFVRLFGTTTPRVTQKIPTRLEVNDSVEVFATGDAIAYLGFIIRDEVTDSLIKRDSIQLPPTLTGNARANVGINLPTSDQGRRVKIASFAVDVAGVTGYSVPFTSTVFQGNASLAFTDTSLIVFGQTYKLPRPGVVGDIVVDTIRSHVLVSNMDANRLEVWLNNSKLFDPLGVAVGSQPWGLAVSINADTLLVANSGGTNISRVFLGAANGDPRTMLEDLPKRIRTRTNFLFVVAETHDLAGAVRLSIPAPKMFSDRPQYIGQIADGTIFFSTKPTATAPEGTVRYLDPSEPFPDLRTFVFVRTLGAAAKNFVLVDMDSARARGGGGTGIPDTIYVFDHLPGTNQPSAMVFAPTCRDPALGALPGRTLCDPTLASPNLDPRFDSRFPGGLPQGTLSAVLAIRTYDPTCSPNCSDMYVIENATPVGITDTTFVSTSADRNWIAFGQGNSSPGFMMMANVDPTLNSPLITQFDLTLQAAERIFGIAIDSTGQTIAAHGSQSYYSSVDLPFHLRLQGIYGDAGTGGAGIAYHPRANGTSSPANERLSFVAAGDKTVHAVDIAYFIRRGRYDLKHQLYGPLRVSRRMVGDDPTIILKLYGISLEGLVVIDLRASDILSAP